MRKPQPMRRSSMVSVSVLAAACAVLLALAALTPLANAQRHSGGSSPPTAPPPHPVATGPVAPVSSGMGAIQFIAVNYGVPAPQALMRQLRADDDRTRAAALSAIGVPGQYLQRGHAGIPRSIQLELVPLGTGEDLQALLTAELDQHIVTAVLVEEDGTWRRIATVFYATSLDDARATPDFFIRTSRSLVQRDRYRAVFRARSVGPNGDFTENEAELRVLNGRAIITMSFASAARECTQPAQPGHIAPPSNGCTITRRWLQSDPADPNKRFMLVTATGKMTPKESTIPIGASRDFQMSHVRNFSCQPFAYSDTQLRFEPTAASAPCDFH